MPKVRLTQRFIDSVKCDHELRKVDYFDVDVKGLMLEVRQAGKTFYLRYQNERGKTRQRKLADARVVKLEAAKDLAIEKLAQITLGNDPFEEKGRRKSTLTVREFVEGGYLPYIKGYKRSWATDFSLLNNHILPAIGDLHLDEIKRQDLIDLYSKHRTTHKPASTNRIIILSRYIFNCAIKWEQVGIVKNPTDGIDLYPENNKLERFLTEDESLRLFNALKESDNELLKYIVAMLLLTGARKREVLDARWRDFDFDHKLWTVEFNKSGKPRYIPISDGLADLLKKVPKVDGCEWVFPSPKTGRPFVTIFNAWNTARKRADLAEVRMHDLRHSFASFLVNSGRSLYEVQKILGHTQTKTTQRYAHLTNNSLVEAAEVVTDIVKLPL
jgi:integrase